MQPSIIDAIGEKKLLLTTTAGILFVDLRNIEYFESDNVYVKLHHAVKGVVWLTCSLKELESTVCGAELIRIHRQYIVPVHRISLYSLKDGGYVCLDTGLQLPVSRKRKAHFQRLLLLK